MALSDPTRRVQNVQFGQAELFAYDATLLKFVSFGYSQDTTLEVSWEQVELRAGSPAIVIDTEITQVSVSLTTQLLELSASNISKLLPPSLVKVTNGAILESYGEIVTLNGILGSLLRFQNIQTVPAPIIKSADGLTTYVTDTGTYAVPLNDGDYIINFVTGQIKRVGGSTIVDGAQITAQYDYSDASASNINMGGKQCSSTVQQFQRLRAISRSKRCAYRGVEIYKASPQSPFTIPFANQFSVVDAKFVGQDDETRPLGLNLFKLILGSDSQV